MAEPTTIDGGLHLIAAAATAKSITLNPDREYTIAHNGVDVSANAVTNTIFLGIDAAPAAATYAADENKFALLDGRAVVIGPGVKTLYFIGYDSGIPTFSIAAGPEIGGTW
jgi:hypothetical protein